MCAVFCAEAWNLDGPKGQGRGKFAGKGGGTPSRPFAVTEARPVECHRAIVFCGAVENAADQEILNHRTVAMQEYNGAFRSTGDVVQAGATRRHKPTSGWVTEFCLPCPAVHE